MDWRSKEPTEKQLVYIRDMMEFSPYPLPMFEGKTRGEAADYIDQHRKLACQNEWAIEHGYG